MSNNEIQRLLITSGDGPRECRLAVQHCLTFMQMEAAKMNVEFDVTLQQAITNDEAPSVLARVNGTRAAEFVTSWIGSVCWTCQSPFRPHHKRRNWFIGIFAVNTTNDTASQIEEKDLRYETFRAGGPGGQHQNTTDSAVRLTHMPSGITVISRDERSQHRNKQTARIRLMDRMILASLQDKAKSRSEENLLHKQLERGSPVRSFKGRNFEEC